MMRGVAFAMGISEITMVWGYSGRLCLVSGPICFLISN